MTVELTRLVRRTKYTSKEGVPIVYAALKPRSLHVQSRYVSFLPVSCIILKSTITNL